MQVNKINNIKNIGKLKTLKLNDNTINKVLSAKTSVGNPIFDNKNVNVLVKLAKLKDTKFFSYIMQNIDGLDYFKKKFDFKTLGFKYIMHANTKSGDTYAEMKKSGLGQKINFIDNKNDKLSSREYFSNSKIVKEKINLSHDKTQEILWDKKDNSISRNTYWGNILKSTKETKFSDNGIIEKIKFSESSTENNNLIKKSSNNDFIKSVKINDILTEKGEISKLQSTYINPITGKKENINMNLSDIQGVYNSTITDENGNKKIESIGRRSPDGSVYVEKNFESLDGTKTHYTYQASKSKKKIHYQIKTDNGEVLTTVDREIKKFSPTVTESIVNGHKYIVKLKNNNIEIKDFLTQKDTTIPLLEFGKDAVKHPTFFTNMSGDMILDMHKRGYIFKYTDKLYESCIDPDDKVIKCINDLYAFSHEQGHSKDVTIKKFSDMPVFNYSITTNPVFRNTFEEERLNFISAFPDFGQKYIDYFINKLEHYNGINGGACEAVAESNAILSTGLPTDKFAIREYFLQKFFPRSIAAASKMLNPNSNLYVK